LRRPPLNAAQSKRGFLASRPAQFNAFFGVAFQRGRRRDRNAPTNGLMASVHSNYPINGGGKWQGRVETAGFLLRSCRRGLGANESSARATEIYHRALSPRGQSQDHAARSHPGRRAAAGPDGIDAMTEAAALDADFLHGDVLGRASVAMVVNSCSETSPFRLLSQEGFGFARGRGASEIGGSTSLSLRSAAPRWRYLSRYL
jgi:hypothetical protein